MAIEDFYNTLYCVNLYSEGTAPNWSPTYALQDEDMALLDKDSSIRAWGEQGSNLKIISKFFCSPAVTVTEKDKITIIENHTIATADLTKYHKADGGSWTLTTSAAIGETCIFYQASNISGAGRKADGSVYNIFVKKNPNELSHHYELMLERVG